LFLRRKICLDAERIARGRIVRKLVQKKEGARLSNETNQYEVYPDKIRYITSILVYSFFIILEAYVLFTNKFKITWNILLLALIAYFFWQVVVTIKTLTKDEPILIISDEGIKDHTSGVDFGLIPWSEVEKVEMFSNNSSLQIGILAAKRFSFHHSTNNKNASKVAQRNRQRIGFTFTIDGVSFKSKKLMEIFTKFKEYGQRNNQAIILKDYENKLLKRNKREK
jgi:hypothetical protein